MPSIKKTLLGSLTHKQAKEKITSQLENALPDLKISMGEKKFSKRIKKAVKILAEDFPVNGNGKKVLVKKEKTPKKAKLEVKKKSVPKKAEPAKASV